MGPARSQNLRAQEPVPARRYDAEGIQGNSGGKEDTLTGKGWEAGTETRTRTGMSTRPGMRATTEAGTGTRIEIRVEGIESLGTFEVVIEVTRTCNQQPNPQDRTPMRDRRIMRRTKSQRRKTGEIIGVSEKEAKMHEKPQRSYRRDMENGGHLGKRRQKPRFKSAGSIDVDPVDPNNSK